MGLDQYLYKQSADYTHSYNEETDTHTETGSRESITDWRKHRYLQGYMEQVYNSKGGEEEFNCEDVELDENDLKDWEQAVLNMYKKHEGTSGFFFGSGDISMYDIEADTQAIVDARQALKEGYTVVYSSWW